MTNTPLWRAVSALGTRDPATPLWRGVIVLRVTTLLFALGSFIVHFDGYANHWLAWSAFGAMTVWTVVSSLFYARPSSRWPWLVGVDLVLTVVLMFTSAWILSTAQFDASTPLITTVWAAVPPAAAGTRFGALGGVLAGLVVSVVTGLVRWRFDVDVARDGFLLTASGFVIGMAATMARRSADALTRALRMEAATAERERLARSIHDSVLQVLAQVRKRGAEFGGEAAELAKMAGEQEIALRALVTTEPTRPSTNGTTDLRSALQLLATPSVQVSTPAGEVQLPEHVTTELVFVAREALLNVEKHAGGEAQTWVLLEDLGTQVVVSIRDDGPGIPPGVLERAAAEGRLGIAESIKGRVRDLGGSVALDTAPGQGTEWEVKVPVAARGKR